MIKEENMTRMVSCLTTIKPAVYGLRRKLKTQFQLKQSNLFKTCSTIAQYTDKAKCISNQYSKYLVKQINMTVI